MATVSAMTGNPVKLESDYPERLSRGLIFVKGILAIPNLLGLALYAIAAWFAVSVAWFAILFTGRIPRGLFDFILGYQRWAVRTNAYLMLMTDQYPPFSGNADVAYPARLTCDYPERLSRGLIFVKGILAIPHFIVLGLYGIAAWFVVDIAWFAILFTGRFPRPLFDFVVGYQRWSARVNCYVFLLHDEYPPFNSE